MKKINLKGVLRQTAAGLGKKSPAILAGMAVVGIFTTAVLAAKGALEAEKRLEEAKAEREPEAELTAEERVKACLPCYAPALTSGVLTAACVIGGHTLHVRRGAALTAAYTLSETALREYRDKVTETFGEKKEKTVRDAAAKERIEKHPVENAEVILTEKGNTLCYDTISGRYFTSDRDKIMRVVNELNRRMRDEMYISLNEFYYELDLKGIRIGEDIGWCIDKGYIDLNFSAQLAADGRPCLVLDYTTAPKYEYR